MELLPWLSTALCSHKRQTWFLGLWQGEIPGYFQVFQVILNKIPGDFSPEYKILSRENLEKQQNRSR